MSDSPFFIPGVLLFFVTTYFVFQRKQYLGISLLILFSILFGFYVCSRDGFLYLWDEQFHALVAKNLSNDWLKPTLYSDDIIPLNYQTWTHNHIWLHKQPLFLWQMALSIKLFGANELAVRIPSILMNGFLVFFAYRIGKITVNKNVGFITAALVSSGYFIHELATGYFSTDHNDVAFLFYTTMSIWAWFEYERSKNPKWLVVIGIASGCAVLVKWLMGLLVFVIWFLSKLFSKNRFNLANYLDILKAGIISLVVFLPWQLYIHFQFPKEASHEMAYNAKHLHHAVEGHAETTWFHFTKAFKEIYGLGDLIPYLYILGGLLLIFSFRNSKFSKALMLTTIFVYAFYTYAATKMISFTIILFPILSVFLAYLIYLILTKTAAKIQHKSISTILFAITIATIGLTSVRINDVDIKKADYHEIFKEREKEKKFFQTIGEKENTKTIIIYPEISDYGHVAAMFYSGTLVYQNVSQIDLENAISNGYKIKHVTPQMLEETK